MGKIDKKAKETSRWKGRLDGDYNKSLTDGTTTVSNVQLESSFDENPPAYHTMYPGILNQLEDRLQQQQQNTPLHQSQELAMLRPSQLFALQLPVFSSSRPSDENKSSDKSSKRKKSHSENDKTDTKEVENMKAESNNGKTSRPIGRLERRITLTEFSKSTQDKIVTKGTGIRHIAAFALKDFCRTTTAHGFRHSLEPNLHIVCRAFWLIITLGSLGLLVFMAYQVTYSAFVIRRPTTEVNYHDNRATGISFPDITICSLSGFWKSKLAKYNVSNSLASYITLSLRGPDLVGQVLLRDQRMALLRKLEFENYMKKINLTITELAKLLSPTCEEVIAACYSEGLVPYYECCKEVLRTVVTPLGVCYSTVGNKRKFNQTLSGQIGGVRIIFSVNLHEYMVHDANVVSSAWLAEEGIHVSVSDYTMTPTVSTNMQAIRIAPNSAASLALSLTTVDHSDVYQSEWPWEKRSPCLRRTDYWHLTEEEKAYTENNLYFTLLYRDCAMEHSNCTLIPFRFANDTSLECTPFQVRQLSLWKNIKKCALEKLKDFNQDGKRLCFTTTINQQLSYTNLYKESLQALQETDQLAKGNLSMVNIFYTRLGYTELFERTPNFLTWFSDLGGQMGLFLGASFITLVELFFILFYLVRVVTFWAMKTLYVQIKKFFSPKVKSDTTP